MSAAVILLRFFVIGCHLGDARMLFQRRKPLDLILATAQKRGLTRQLGAFDLTMLGIGAVIGTGIFVLTSVAANKAGPGRMRAGLA